MPHLTKDGHWGFWFNEFMEWNEKRPDQLGVYFGWNCPWCWSRYADGCEGECKQCGATRKKMAKPS